MEREMIALIDSDVILYKCGFGAQHIWYYIYDEDDYWIAKFRYKKEALKHMNDAEGLTLHSKPEVEPLENALYLCKQLLNNILKKTRATEYKLYLTGDGNYREDIATILPYKGNRDKSHKPFWYNEIKSYLIEEWGAEVVEGYEADDALSMGQFKDVKNTVICTTDKDLNGMYGWHYNWDKQDKPVWITEWDARRFFYWQMLTGDKSVDNIQGIPGIGPVKADKILDSSCPEGYEERVKQEYIKAYDNGEEAMEENARLLWMSRRYPNDWEWGSI